MLSSPCRSSSTSCSVTSLLKVWILLMLLGSGRASSAWRSGPQRRFEPQRQERRSGANVDSWSGIKEWLEKEAGGRTLVVCGQEHKLARPEMEAASGAARWSGWDLSAAPAVITVENGDGRHRSAVTAVAPDELAKNYASVMQCLEQEVLEMNDIVGEEAREVKGRGRLLVFRLASVLPPRRRYWQAVSGATQPFRWMNTTLTELGYLLVSVAWFGDSAVMETQRAGLLIALDRRARWRYMDVIEHSEHSAAPWFRQVVIKGEGPVLCFHRASCL